MWPGYGENSRVLKWVVERVNDAAPAVDTPIGRLPAPGALELRGLDLGEARLGEVLKVDVNEWRGEVPKIAQHFDNLGNRLPRAMRTQLDALAQRLAAV